MEKVLPKGWVETTVGEVMIEVKEKVNPVTVPNASYIGLEHLKKNGGLLGVGEANKLKSQKSVFKKGDVLYGKLRPYLNKHIITDFNGICSTDILIYRSLNSESSKLFNYYLGLAKTIQKANLEAKGINLPRISSKILNTFPFPLPPLAEQKRIVKKLDGLFGHLEKVEDLLAKVPQLLKDFRQSVLTMAVSGQLTEEWRRGKELEEWKEVLLSEVLEKSLNGISKRRSSIGTPTIVLRLADIKNYSINLTKSRNILLSQKEIDKYKLKRDDILVIRVNGSKDIVGRFVHLEEPPLLTYCDHFIRLRLNENISSKFLAYISHSSTLREYISLNMVSSAGQNTVSGRTLGNMPIPLPTLTEQAEIVRQVEHLFQIADGIEAQYELLKAKVEVLPQAILAKAFRGELVEQLDTDGDARALLEEIRKMKAALKPKKKRRK